MTRIDPDALADDVLTRVFLAATLREARAVEELLTQHGVDYVVEVEPFGSTLFGTLRHGVVFSVTTGQAEFCRSRLRADGLEWGVLDGP
jgi:hypothetical protein